MLKDLVLASGLLGELVIDDEYLVDSLLIKLRVFLLADIRRLPRR